MAGPFDFLQNPKFKQFISEAGQDLGYGLSQGNDFGQALGIATQRTQQMQPYRDERADLEAKNALGIDQLNITTEWLRNRGYEDLLPLVSAGQGGVALSEALKRMQPGYGKTEAIRPIEVNGQLVDPITGAILGDYRDPNAGRPAAPSGYQYSAPGQLSPIPGGPQDPASAPRKAPTEAELRAAGLSTVIEPDAKLLLGDGTPQNPGIFDALGSGADQALSTGVGGVAPLAGFASGPYRQAKDAVTSIAQSYLYSTSGASAPDAEVQRAVDSVTPKPFDTPKQVADKKVRLQVMVDSIRQKQGNAAPASSGSGWEVIGVTQ